MLRQPQLLAQHQRGGAGEPASRIVDALVHGIQAPRKRSTQPLLEQGQRGQPQLARRGNELGRGGGRRRTEIGAEVGDGEVGFMADAADDRHRALHDRARQRLVVEGPEILDRAAAAHQQDHVHLRPQRVERMQRAHQFPRRAGALHGGRCQHDGNVRHAPPQGCDHVMQRGSAQRGHDADRPRHGGQRPLAGGVEQAFGLEARLALQELLEQRALPGPAQALDHQLQIAARLVHRQATADLDLVAIARREIEQARGAPEHGAAQLAAFVLQREVAVAAGCAREAADLAAHRDRIEARLERIRDGAAQRAHGPHTRTAGLRRVKFAHRAKASQADSRPQAGRWPAVPAEHWPGMHEFTYKPLI